MQLESLLSERDMLRKELQELKNCQVRYFSISITATAILFGVLGRFVGGPPTGEFFLIPLLVVLPCWWIFFDKATTITRIVAYCRILDTRIYSFPVGDYAHAGWENALNDFRGAEEKALRQSVILSLFLALVTSPFRIVRLLAVKTLHRYWLVNWFTFFGLATACVALGIVFSCSNMALPIVAVGLVLAFSGSTAAIVMGLITGEYSYQRNYEKWSDLLSKVVSHVSCAPDK